MESDPATREFFRLALDAFSELRSLRDVLDGLPPEAIVGGWTAKGISEHAKNLESQLEELRKQEPIAWTDEQELRDLESQNCAYLYKIDPDNPYHDSRRQILIYREPVPKAVIQPFTLPSGITLQDAKERWCLRTDAEQQAAFIAWNACLRESRSMHQCSPVGNDLLTRNLVMLVKRLGSSLRHARPDHNLPAQAMQFLSENNLVSVSDVLRTESAPIKKVES